MLILSLTFCSKDKDTSTDNDPSNLTVEIMSANPETGMVTIQATAVNTVQYQLFASGSNEADLINETGFFEYTYFNTGTYTVEVRAIGSNGKYIKKSKQVVLADNPEVPLDMGYTTPLQYDGYQLVWNDEFTGSSVNTSNWNYDIGNGCPGNCGWGNNELEYYRSENAWVKDDYLTIEARSEVYSGYAYTSTKMHTKNKFSFQYGRLDIRALLPKGQGIWPALWMLGDNINSVGWPSSGEIDVMELVGGGNGKDNVVHGTIHYNNNGHVYHGGAYTLTSGIYAQSYHVFSLIWDEEYLRWYMDDQLFYEAAITESFMTEFHQKYWIILNVAVGGNWPGNPDQSTVFPQQMRVDYVRVFQKDSK